jgi:radical SAM protein with 4Fe4S-binding SPASM domain
MARDSCSSRTSGDLPERFPPLSAGNVRTHELSEVYRTSPLFQALRDTSLLRGKCGRCEFKKVCGGSRARAYAMTGIISARNPFAFTSPRNPIMALPPTREKLQLEGEQR